MRRLAAGLRRPQAKADDEEAEGTCACPGLCQPLASAPPEREVVVFATGWNGPIDNGDDWRYFDWRRTTTVVVMGGAVCCRVGRGIGCCWRGSSSGCC